MWWIWQIIYWYTPYQYDVRTKKLMLSIPMYYFMNLSFAITWESIIYNPRWLWSVISNWWGRYFYVITGERDVGSVAGIICSRLCIYKPITAIVNILLCQNDVLSIIENLEIFYPKLLTCFFVKCKIMILFKDIADWWKCHLWNLYIVFNFKNNLQSLRLSFTKQF